MENQFQQPQPIQADITETTPLETWSGGQIWAKGYILRVFPGEEGDNLIPFEVFFDPATGRILDNTLPEEIRSEYNKENPQFTPDEDNVINWDDDETTDPSTAKSSTPDSIKSFTPDSIENENNTSWESWNIQDSVSDNSDDSNNSDNPIINWE